MLAAAGVESPSQFALLECLALLFGVPQIRSNSVERVPCKPDRAWQASSALDWQELVNPGLEGHQNPHSVLLRLELDRAGLRTPLLALPPSTMFPSTLAAVFLTHAALVAGDDLRVFLSPTCHIAS